MKAVWPVGRRLFDPEEQPGGGLSRCGAGCLGMGEHRSDGCDGHKLDGYHGDVGQRGSDEHDRNGAAWGPGLGYSQEDFTGQGRGSCRGGLERGGCFRESSKCEQGGGSAGRTRRLECVSRVTLACTASSQSGAAVRVSRRTLNPALFSVSLAGLSGRGSRSTTNKKNQTKTM